MPASPTPLVPSVLVVDGDGRVVDVEADRVGRGRHAGSRRTSADTSVPASSCTASSHSAWAMPCTRPPCTWPATISGLTMLPMSSTQAYLRIFSAAGLGVDLDRAQVRAVREGEVHRVVGRVGVERRLDAVGQVVRREGRQRDLADRQALVGALDAEPAGR